MKSLVFLKRDFLASLVVFLVALPLCMGIAVASGVPVEKGLLAGIIGGVVVGLLAGCPLQVSGPAAGLTVVVYQFVQEHGVENLGWIVLGGGIIQIVAGGLRLGGIFRSVPPSLIAGMLSGIGLLIFASQFHVMVDHKPSSSALENLMSIPESVLLGMTYWSDLPHFEAACIGMLTLTTIVAWNRYRPKSLQMIPGPLMGIVTATVVTFGLELPILKIDMPGAFLSSIKLPSLEGLKLTEFLFASLTLAVIASAETLLCAGSVDQLHDGEPTHYDKELLAQGVGNSLAGLLGALPITGVIVRSSANIEAGGKTRWSAVFHGFWILLCVLYFTELLKLVPMSGLAAILVYTGLKLVGPHHIRALRPFGVFEVTVYVVTVVAIVATDLLTGVGIGFGLSLLVHIYRVSNLRVDTSYNEELGVYSVVLFGVVSFLNYHKVLDQLDRLPKQSTIEIDTSRLLYMDHAFFQAIQSWKKRGGHSDSVLKIARKDVHALKV